MGVLDAVKYVKRKGWSLDNYETDLEKFNSWYGDISNICSVVSKTIVELYSGLDKFNLRHTEVSNFLDAWHSNITNELRRFAGDLQVVFYIYRGKESVRLCFNIHDFISSWRELDTFTNEKKSTVSVERAKMKPGLRYDVLKRDNFTYQICGRTAKDGVTLEVDHKVPVSKGGKTELDNLWTLCFDCNRGKSDKLD